LEVDTLSVIFKGERDYIQGGDIFDCIHSNIAKANERTYISKLILKRKVSTLPCVADTPANSFGMVFFSDENQNIVKRYLNETNAVVTDRREYKEEIIVDSSEFSDEAIKCPFSPGFSTIEHIISLNKAFNNHKFGTSNGKWLFARIILNRKLPFSFRELQVQLSKSTNGVYTVCNVYINGINLGEVHFVLDVK
jgi:hypothetical protein